MSTTSASPDRLGQFVDRTTGGRTSAADDQRTTSSFAASVRARCADFGVDAPAVHSLALVLEAMAGTEAFVTTIRSELLAADGGALSPVVTVADTRIATALDTAGVGLPPTPIEFEPATGYGLPPTSGFVDDPICAANGNMIHQDLDLEQPGVAHALDLRRTYNSLLTRRVGAFGPGFSSIFDVRLTCHGAAATDRIEVHLPDGATAAFVHTATGWGSAGRRVQDFERLPDGWMVRTDRRHGYRFDDRGALTGWMAGVSEVAVARDSGGRIVSMRECRSGRRIHIDWCDGRVAQIATDDGRRVTYTYRDDGRLVRATGCGGHLNYHWDDGLLTSVEDPDGVRPFVNEYDPEGRVIRQRSPFGRVTTYRYDAAGLTVITDQAGTRQAMVHDHRGNLTAVIDADGSAMRLTYDHADRVTRVVERDGATWGYEFDPDTGDLVRRVDPDGLEAQWSWDAHGRILESTDRAGYTTRYSYLDDAPELTTPIRIVDAAGAATVIDVDPELDRPRSVTDADGVATTYAYDGDGQLAAVIDGLGHRTSLDYDAAGRLVRRTDPIGAMTRLDYDPTGRLARYDRAGAVGTFTRTAAGRVVTGRDAGIEDEWSATFGEHGAPLSVTDAAGNTITLDYDELGDVIAITTADGATYHQFHDPLGRLVGAADPTGATSHLRYDVAGRVVEAIDAAGRSYRRDVDQLGRTIRSVAPDGAITSWSYHPCGQIASVTTPDGSEWSTAVDHAGRVTQVTDPAGRISEFAYTPAGRPSERRSPAGRVERMAYDAAGRPSESTAADGALSTFERDAAGRVVAVGRGRVRDEFERDVAGRIVAHRSITPVGRTHQLWEYDAAGNVTVSRDGTGATSEFDWDCRGLLTGATDPAGGVLGYEYDARGRIVAQTTPGDRTTRFRYGPAGYLDEVVDPGGVITSIDVDPTGVVIGQRCGSAGWSATLDAAGRVVERVDLVGAVLARFGYDDAGRLVDAGVDGIVEQFTWDPSGRLNSTTVRAADEDATTRIERDADGWVIAVTRPDGARLDIRRDGAGRICDIAGIPAALPPNSDDPQRDLAGRLLLARDGSAFHYDDAGRLARIEGADGADTTFEYDGAGLVSVERGAAGIRRFRYDEAGRVCSVTVDGRGTTTFDYDDSGRRSGERRPDGSRVDYEWTGLSRLAAIVVRSASGVERRIPIVTDAHGRPVRVGDHEVAYDVVSGLPCRIDDVRIVNTPTLTWCSDTGRTHDRGTAPAGLRVGNLTFLGARVHDAGTNQFLSPDPLLPMPGSPGAASAYTYAWHDPVNNIDPSGLRPISLEEWEAIRTREEQGRVGQAIEAMIDDPWGTLAMAGVLVAGVALAATGVGAVAVPLLLGMALAGGVGFATGNFSPRDVAMGGIMGAAGGAVANSLRVGAISLRTAMVRQGAVGTAGEVGGQVVSGDGVNLYDGVVTGVLNAGTFGLGERIAPRSLTSGFLLGAGTEGTANVAGSVLTGEPIDAREALLEAGFGGLGETVDIRFDAGHAQNQIDIAGRLAHGDIPSVAETTTVYRASTSWAEQEVFAETGLVLSDVARSNYGDINDLVDATGRSVDHHAAAVDEWYDSPTDYAAAQAEWDGEIREVSGDLTMIELTTDLGAAQAAAGDHGAVLTAEVPTATLVSQYQDGAVFTPHMIRMEALEFAR